MDHLLRAVPFRTSPEELLSRVLARGSQTVPKAS